MPNDSCIDFNPQTPPTPPYSAGIDFGNCIVPTFNAVSGLDIMFAPDGTVQSIGNNPPAPPRPNPIAFWVCTTVVVQPADGSAPVIDAMHGTPSLVVVYPRTGQIASYVVGQGVTTANKANAMGNVQ